MPPEIQLTSDDRLGDSTIIASFNTARELRSLLGGAAYHIRHSLLFADDQISVSPDLYDAFEEFLKNLSGTHNAYS